MKRIFVAIPISEQLQREILEWKGKFEIRIPTQSFDVSPRRMTGAKSETNSKSQILNSKVRWIEGKNLHVTLVPPWYAQEAPLAAKLLKQGQSIPEIIKKLKDLEGKFPPFEMQFKKISFGPNPRQPRVIWATGEADETINDLRLTIYQALEQETEDRPFKLHVTLARFKTEDFPKLPVKELDEQVSWKQEADSFALMESHLSSHGADYEVLEKIKLA